MQKPFVEIFLFIDALGWEIVSRTGFLKDLLPYRRKIEMQFGYSSTAIPTILSGKTPAEHGHLGLFRFAPEDSPFRKLGKLAPFLKPDSFWNRGRIRHHLSRIIGKLYGFTGYFQLYRMPISKLPLMDYCEKKDLFASHGMEEIENLRDLLSRLKLSFHISDWRKGDKRAFEEARGAIANGKRFLFLYTAELDALLHDFPVPPVSDVIAAKLEWYRSEILSLFETCKEKNCTLRLTVISDHGMTPLSKTVDLKSAVEKTHLVFGKDYGACFDSTMFRAFFLSPEAEKVIREAVKPFETCGHWLTVEEEKHYGIYRADRRFGDAIFLLDAGIQIVPSDMGGKPLNGMHGFAPEDKDSYAVILSTSEIPQSVLRVADYYSLMKFRAEEMAEKVPQPTP
ncbi:MAG: alkaline phosphatase family protein [Lentisphaeria bacterium]|nr:alkaline phosphatase family protein [Lentisphaeria bacterium]